MSRIADLESALGNGGRPFRYNISIGTPSDLGIDSEKINLLAKATSIPGVRIQPRQFYHKGHVIPISGTKVYDTEWNCTFYLDDTYDTRLVLERWISAQDSFLGGLTPLPKPGIMGTIKNLVEDKLIGGLESLAEFAKEETSFSKIVGDVSNKLKSEKASHSTHSTKMKDNEFVYYLFGTVDITPMGYANVEDIVTYTLHNAFPISLQPIQFDDSNLTSISEFSCSFAFSHYTIFRPESLAEKVIGMF